jgi:hypothetical protein
MVLHNPIKNHEKTPAFPIRETALIFPFLHNFFKGGIHDERTYC